MGLTVSQKNRITDAVNVAFNRIGDTPLTKMPDSDDNSAPVLWEYWLSYHLNAMARARLEAAKVVAEKSGVIFGRDHDPFPVGYNDTFCTGDQVAVWLQVKSGARRVNIDAMCDYLKSHGVNASLLIEAVALATNTSRPAHEFRPSLLARD